jgi:hypothetical protein
MDWPGANPGLRGERPATNYLNHGTAHPSLISNLIILTIAIICGLFTDAISSSDYTASNELINDELERIRKEAAVA